MSQFLEIAYSTTYYYAREHLWRQLSVYCHEQFSHFNDSFFVFWKAFGYAKENLYSEAINFLNSVLQRKDIQFAAICSLIDYHQNCKTIDREALSDLKKQQQDALKFAPEKAILAAIYYYMHIGDLRRAKKLCSNANSNNLNIQCAQAWLEFSENNYKNALEIFEQNLAGDSGGNPQHLESLIGKSKVLDANKNYTGALDILNEIIVIFPKFLPAQNDKAIIHMQTESWQSLEESLEQIFLYMPQNLIALKLQCFYSLAILGDISQFLEKFTQLVSVIEKTEPQNIDFMLNLAKLFSRISGRNPYILKMTMGVLMRAKKVDPLNDEIVLELAYEYQILKDYNQAFNLFKEAASLNETSIEALNGMINCRIFQGMIEDAEQQIQFVEEIQEDQPKSAELPYLKALIAYKKEEGDEISRIVNSLKWVDESLKIQIATVRNAQRKFSFYILLNPNFLMSLAEQYLLHCQQDDTSEFGRQMIPYVSKGIKLLETIIKSIPGMGSAHLLLAKAKLTMKDSSAALNHVTRCLEMDPKNEEAAIMSAMIQEKNGNFRNALSTISEAIANNFKVRNNPLFMLVKGKIELLNEDYAAGLETLQVAFNIKGIAEQDENELNKINAGKVIQFSENDRCQIYCQLAKAYAMNQKATESKTLINKTIAEFAGTPQEVTVLIANSQINIELGDIKKALNILRAVQTDSPYFVESRIIMADVYLKHLKDRRHYAKCYRDIIQENSSFENLKQLGFALMKIQEPENALNAFLEAQKLNPSDIDIIKQIGNCYVQTHNYQLAQDYYRDLVKSNLDPSIQLDIVLDYGKLCLKIREFAKAQELLKEDKFCDEFKQITLQVLKQRVDALTTIYKLQIKMKEVQKDNDRNKLTKAKESIEKAIQSQQDVIERCKIEGGNIEEERILLSNLQYEYGKFSQKYDNNYGNAITMLEKAWKMQPQNQKILILLIQIYKNIDDKENCEVKCLQLLKINPNHELASLMLSDLMLSKNETSKVYEEFQKILEQKPDNYGILSKMIEIYRRLGYLDKVQKYIQKAEKKTPNINEPGLCFCRGLYYQYMRKPHEALKEFMISKHQSSYMETSIVNMVWIYLNPQNELLFSSSDESQVTRNIDMENLKTADNLLHELSQHQANQLKISILQSYILMFSRQKQNIELAQNRLLDILKAKQQDYPPANFALAVVKYILKKPNETKALLIQLAKRPFTSEFAEEMELAWLHLGELQMNSGAPDEAKALFEQCINYNCACGKAEELLGVLKEKEQNYLEACQHYIKANKLTNESSASICYRLGYLYLKLKKYVDCVDICMILKKLQPEQQKIDKELLSKARNALRA